MYRYSLAIIRFDGEYAAFGKCADDASIKTAVKYGKAKTGRWQQFSDMPFNPIVIKTITVDENAE